MKHTIYEDADGRHITELDGEAIDFLIEALVELRDLEPGEELTTPSFVTEEDDLAMSDLVLRRVTD